MTKQRYDISCGGADEPGLILIGDSEAGIIVARSSEIALKHVQELVRLANAACADEPSADALDAARYRWLKANMGESGTRFSELAFDIAHDKPKEDWDSAIDAELASALRT